MESLSMKIRCQASFFVSATRVPSPVIPVFQISSISLAAAFRVMLLSRGFQGALPIAFPLDSWAGLGVCCEVPHSGWRSSPGEAFSMTALREAALARRCCRFSARLANCPQLTLGNVPSMYARMKRTHSVGSWTLPGM